MPTLPATDRDCEKVAVALSGGVDSAVAAALLKRSGADVFAITLRLLPNADVSDAVRVAAHLGIEHHIVDLVETFQKDVVDPFVASYMRGETPSPCVRCNRFIKFGAMADAARALGAQALATGHYARRVVQDGETSLYRGSDQSKDQSYFLFSLLRQQLAFARFPLGEMTKEQTRALAHDFGLPVADKGDSQDICFVPNGDYGRLVQERSGAAIKSGEIVDQAGTVIGQHEGLIHFTIGQRKGLNLGMREGDHNDPLYVLRLDPLQNRVVVGPRSALAQREVHLCDVNWLAPDVSSEGLSVEAKLRSTHTPVAALYRPFEKDCAVVFLDTPQFGIAKGQACVLYHGDKVLGGGWIANAV
jgi:tRNA-specific 2-thiouridylase